MSGPSSKVFKTTASGTASLSVSGTSESESLAFLAIAALKPLLELQVVIPRLKNKTAVYAGRVVTKVKDSNVDAVVCVPT